MKLRSRDLILTSLALGLLLCGTTTGLAGTVTVTPDPAKTWVGWMNVSELPANGGAYLWGSGWGTADLPAVFTGNQLKLSPNTNCYNPADAYWTNPDGSGNKQMEANFYVDDPALAGNDVHFTGFVTANTLVAPYQSVAFIKEFTADYSALLQMITVPLVGGSAFNVFATIAPGNHGQFGFMTTGPDANPATVGLLGAALVIPEPSSIGLGLVLAALAYRRR